MSAFYRIACFIVIVLCTGCNNSNANKALIFQQRQNSQPLILTTSKILIKDDWPGLLTFSPDSQLLMAHYSGFDGRIYLFNDDKPPLIFNSENYPELTKFQFRYAGFIDNNYGYISGSQETDQTSRSNKPMEFKVFIYQLDSPKLISEYTYEYSARHPVKVNKDFIAVNENLTNWHTKQSWKVKIAHPAITAYLLTPSGQIVTFNWYNDWILLSDPINNNHYSWDSGIDIYLMELSGSGDYLIALDDKGDCVAWRLSDRSEIGHCGGGNWFSKPRKMLIITNPLNDQFAFISDNKITVYSLPSLENILELTFDGEISDANFSGDLLVVKDDTGRSELWQVSSKKLLGISPDIYPYLPTIQPNSEHIAWIIDNQLKFFKIPKID